MTASSPLAIVSGGKAVKPHHSLRSSEPTVLEAVGCDVLRTMVQARNDDDDDCIGSILEICHACCQEFVKFSL